MAAREAAGQAGFDALLAWSTAGSSLYGYADVFWLTNHYSQVPRVPVEIPGIMRGWGQAAFVLPVRDGTPTLVVESSDWRPDLVVSERVVDSHDLYARAAQALVELGLGKARIGIAGTTVMPHSGWEVLRAALPGATLLAADNLLGRLRMRKSPAEVAMMRHASAAGAAIQNAMVAALREGGTDNDLARVAYQVCADTGAVPWEFAFASGPHSGHGYWPRLPAWDRTRRYRRGDIVHPDVYGAVNGYLYDVQRTYIVGGEISPKLRRLLDGVTGVVDALCASCRPGVAVAEVARTRTRWLGEHGLLAAHEVISDTSVRPLAASGHGLGAGFELPWVYEGSEEILEPGMTIALEVYLADTAVGTVANEEVVLVTEGEPEILTADSPSRHW